DSKTTQLPPKERDVSGSISETPTNLKDLDQLSGFENSLISEDDNATESDEEEQDRLRVNGADMSEVHSQGGLSSGSKKFETDCRSNKEKSPSIADFALEDIHSSSYEYPNGNVVETIDVLPTDEVYRVKSTGWACLTPQSWSGAVKPDGEVVVKLSDGAMKPDTKTFKILRNSDHQTQALLKEKQLEKVDIVKRLCIGVYRCPYCAYSERPRIPQRGKKNSSTTPEPPKSKCVTHKCDLDWYRCTASMISIFYHVRLKAEVHHVGIHKHEKPPVLRAN
ncbi:hypothetical protein BGW38_008390, partial [Lunasporangiospora selenospora]